jgi:hypothetical protein
MPSSSNSRMVAPGRLATAGVGRDQHLHARLRHELDEGADEREIRVERQPGIRLVADEEALAREPVAVQHLEEGLAVARLGESRLSARRGVVLEVGEEAMHRLDPHEVAPARGAGAGYR